MFTRYIPSVKETIVYKKGRDAQDNFDLIDDSKEEDIWFHIHGDSSAHVVACIHDLKISLDKKIRWSDTYLDKSLGRNFEIDTLFPLQIYCVSVRKWSVSYA